MRRIVHGGGLSELSFVESILSKLKRFLDVFALDALPTTQEGRGRISGICGKSKGMGVKAGFYSLVFPKFPLASQRYSCERKVEQIAQLGKNVQQYTQ